MGGPSPALAGGACLSINGVTILQTNNQVECNSSNQNSLAFAWGKGAANAGDNAAAGQVGPGSSEASTATATVFSNASANGCTIVVGPYDSDSCP